MTTFMKIISQLPNLERLTLGPTELQLKHRLDALRGTLTELIAAATGVLAVIQSASPRTAPEPPLRRRRGEAPPDDHGTAKSRGAECDRGGTGKGGKATQEHS